MKKWALIFIATLCLLISSIYVFIPSTLRISEAVKINCTVDGTNRFLTHDDNWEKWWPQNKINKSQDNFSYAGFTFKPIKKLYNRQMVIIEKNDLKIQSFIDLIQLSNDSLIVRWHTEMNTNINPIKRLKQYNNAVKIKRSMHNILIRLQTFLADKNNIYDYEIHKDNIQKTYLVATISAFTHYPSTAEIYESIDKLKKYIALKEAVETNFPMVNITGSDSTKYEAMIAIPTNKELPGSGSIFMKRIVTEKVLAGKVQGGTYEINNALKQLQTFLDDYHLTSPAIPFQSLVTDRLNQPDTSKWITIVYLPIF